jgi:hypothetical protein
MAYDVGRMGVEAPNGATVIGGSAERACLKRVMGSAI